VAVQHEGVLLRARIQVNASGRPGPNIVTGRYRSSWQVVAKKFAGGAQVTVGTEAPQGPRLEYGFVGTDALGRTYDQPPFPHVGPAVAESGQSFPDAVKRAVKGVFG